MHNVCNSIARDITRERLKNSTRRGGFGAFNFNFKNAVPFVRRVAVADNANKLSRCLVEAVVNKPFTQRALAAEDRRPSFTIKGNSDIERRNPLITKVPSNVDFTDEMFLAKIVRDRLTIALR